ncbi:MAG: 2-oxo acid dehydrogenase subunit E2 [Candidatus Melainabacteria bacterium]|nr:2-oxo acid dehydrogenase subunit E2 [Candidatus Melainabacteria bacterium]
MRLLEHGRIDSRDEGPDGGGSRHWRYRSTSRYRFNVLDLLNLFGQKALMYHMFADLDMTRVQAYREQARLEGKRITITAFLLKAISMAQVEHPVSRTFFLPPLRAVTYNNIVGGFTVERMINGSPAVFFGEIERPHEKSLEEIARSLEEFAEDPIDSVPKLRVQKIFAEMPVPLRQIVWHLGEWFPALRVKCMGATFGLSSLGALGIDSVCGPSVCTCVFGIGQLVEKVVAKDGALFVKPLMTVALSFDQRVMSSYQAARFFEQVKELMEGELAELKALDPALIKEPERFPLSAFAPAESGENPGEEEISPEET